MAVTSGAYDPAYPADTVLGAFIIDEYGYPTGHDDPPMEITPLKLGDLDD